MNREERMRVQQSLYNFSPEEKEETEKVEVEKIEVEPSRARSFGRKVMDFLRIKFRKSENLQVESAPVEVPQVEEVSSEEQEVEEEPIQDEVVDDEERRLLETEMSKARTLFERDKQRDLRRERVQELIERKLNSELTTVAGLEEAVLEGEEGVDKRTVEYEGEEVVVYDLKGKPFRILSHAVDFRHVHVGFEKRNAETAQAVVDDPSLWTRTREEVEADPRSGEAGRFGNVVFVSYVNSEKNMDTRMSRFDDGHYALCYGFERVRPGSLIRMVTEDAHSHTKDNSGKTELDDLHAVEKLEAASGTYNEGAFWRYDEEGKPLMPSYIIVEDGHVSEEALRHARHFGIPIINIEGAPYKARLEKRAREAVEGITEESSYDEITDAIVALRQAPTLSRVPGNTYKFNGIASVGRKKDMEAHEAIAENSEPDSFEEKIRRLEELELKKRMELIEAALRSGKKPGSSVPEGFVYFSVSENTPGDGTIDDVPGKCRRISVSFRREGDSRPTNTTIYDGARVVRGEEAVQSGVMTQEELDAGDSTYYDRLSPLVAAYDRKK